MSDTYLPTPAFAVVGPRPASLRRRLNTLLDWLDNEGISAYAIGCSDASTTVTLRAIEGGAAAQAAHHARLALPGGRLSITARHGSHGLVVRADGDVPGHGPVRLIACVNPDVAELICQAEDITGPLSDDDGERDIDPRSLKVAAGLVVVAAAASPELDTVPA